MADMSPMERAKIAKSDVFHVAMELEPQQVVVHFLAKFLAASIYQKYLYRNFEYFMLVYAHCSHVQL
jgi:hypothetical protein